MIYKGINFILNKNKWKEEAQIDENNQITPISQLEISKGSDCKVKRNKRKTKNNYESPKSKKKKIEGDHYFSEKANKNKLKKGKWNISLKLWRAQKKLQKRKIIQRWKGREKIKRFLSSQ